MRLGVPTIEGVIDRRVLVNFRIDPDRIQQVLPGPLQPQLIGEHVIGGICLIRLKEVRPQGWPKWVTLGSENAAHRIAVQWNKHGQCRTGVYIPRRDTNSRLNTLIGGHLFPGVHHRGDFAVEESSERVRIAMTSRDGAGSISVDGSVADTLPDGSVFDSVQQASAFFEQGSLGLSPTRDEDLEALELETLNWSHSRFESRRRRIPAGDSSLPGQTAHAAGRRLRSQPAEILDARSNPLRHAPITP